MNLRDNSQILTSIGVGVFALDEIFEDLIKRKKINDQIQEINDDFFELINYYENAIKISKQYHGAITVVYKEDLKIAKELFKQFKTIPKTLDKIETLILKMKETLKTVGEVTESMR